MCRTGLDSIFLRYDAFFEVKKIPFGSVTVKFCGFSENVDMFCRLSRCSK